MMKRILLMRHAKSSWSNPGLSDHQRPLNKRGKRDAPRMGRFLADEDLLPDLILCSTAARARATAEGIMDAPGFEGEVEYHDELYHADTYVFIELLQKLPETIRLPMLVGHNPEMSYFMEMICEVHEYLTTANAAVIELPVTKWAEVDHGAAGEIPDHMKVALSTWGM